MGDAWCTCLRSVHPDDPRATRGVAPTGYLPHGREVWLPAAEPSLSCRGRNHQTSVRAEVALLALLLSMAIVVPQDSGAVTQLRITIDAAVWRDAQASSYLPQAFGSGYSTDSVEVRLCDRLLCTVLVRADSAAGRREGDVVFGVQPGTGRTLWRADADSLPPRVQVKEVAPPPGPDYSVDADSMPVVYHLSGAIIAVPEEALPRLVSTLIRTGAAVGREADGFVISFPNTTFRLQPAWRGAGVVQLNYFLRREVGGNPTYRFGPTTRLRFGPGRAAVWQF